MVVGRDASQSRDHATLIRVTDSGKPDFGMTDSGIGLIQLWKQQRDRAYTAAMSTTIGSPAVLLATGQVSFAGLAPNVLTETVKVAEQLAAELVDDAERLRPVLERVWTELIAVPDES